VCVIVYVDSDSRHSEQNSRRTTVATLARNGLEILMMQNHVHFMHSFYIFAKISHTLTFVCAIFKAVQGDLIPLFVYFTSCVVFYFRIRIWYTQKGPVLCINVYSTKTEKRKIHVVIKLLKFESNRIMSFVQIHDVRMRTNILKI